MDIVTVLIATLLLILGAGYPMFAIWRLSLRINRTDRAVSSAYMMVQFLLIAVVPLAAMLVGFSLLLPSLWESAAVRIIVYAATGLAIGGFVAQIWLSRSAGKSTSSQG